MDTSKAKRTVKRDVKDQAEQKYVCVGEMAVERVRVVEGKKGDIVFFTLVLDGLYIYNCRVATGKEGDFVSWPQMKGNDGKYYNVVYGRLTETEEKAIIAEVQRQIDEGSKE